MVGDGRRKAGHATGRPARYVIAAPLNRGAVSTYFLALATELERRGAEVWFVAPAHSCPSIRPTVAVRLYFWPSRRPTRLRDAKFIFRLLRAVRPDCVISNFGAVNLMTLTGWLLRVPSRTCWYRTMAAGIDTDSPKSPARLKALRLRKRLVFKLATRFVAPSTAAADDLCVRFGVTRSRIEVWPDAIEDPVASRVVELVPAERRRGIVCVGGLTKNKGQDVLLIALARIRAGGSPLHAVFAGDGPERHALEDLADQVGVRSDCTFSGYVDRHEVFELMSRALVTVVPSRSEAFGIVAIESMAVGTPVVASGVDGLKDVVGPDVGFLFDPEDANQLANRLLQLASDLRLRAALGTSARQLFLERYERDTVVSGLADHLQDATRSR